MKSARTLAALILLSVFVAGCRHKPPAPPPPAAQAPILPAGSMPQPHTPPQLPPPETPKVGLQTAKAAPPPETAPKHPRHHHPKPATDETAAKDAAGKDAAAKDTTGKEAAGKDQTSKEPESATAPAATQQAANMTPIPNTASPIGQLSTAGDAANTMSRDAILQKINQTESGLNGIKRSLTSEEQTTTTQIRTFLMKAKQALEQDDLDGAHTLLTKAQVLLDELTKQ